ncbi:hypothetical protein P4H61_15865 [Paenibacillus peoriae]|uniref:hypothetical protein n=1 Tax=Paenibacillus peoriae TaxID=59893 RepID=UPI00026C65C3|nr:hypothetical protein [Paenibacillus peoriae]MEC0182961.1 hypothetical protein [Paenibacillus peoriae]
MKGVAVSIDRIVIGFTDVYWDFFNEFHKRLCHFYGVKMTVGERRFQYRIRINTGKHFLHISYKIIFGSATLSWTDNGHNGSHSWSHGNDCCSQRVQ